MINFMISSFFVVLFLFAFFTSSYYWLQNKKLKVRIVQVELDLEIASKFFIENSTDKEENEKQAKEDFIKFLSDSRDWSYQYIEDAQKIIHTFIKEIEPEIRYFDEYGVVGSAWPHYYSMKKISSAYKELKTLLPEDYGKLE
jgi:membrane-associated HD superfamily phosphohydrolase